MNKPIFTKEEYEALEKCVCATIRENNIALERHMFSDEEDIDHFNYINEYNEKLRKIRFKLDVYIDYFRGEVDE